MIRFPLFRDICRLVLLLLWGNQVLEATEYRFQFFTSGVKLLVSDRYVIETENLTKKFGDFTAVQDLNLKVKEGEIFGFLGPNGAGKTTSIRMMVGLLSPTSGKVNFGGLGDSLPEEKVGVCPQDLVLWEELTSFENLRFMGNMYGVKKAS